jgi:hypothetical protein
MLFAKLTRLIAFIFVFWQVPLSLVAQPPEILPVDSIYQLLSLKEDKHGENYFELASKIGHQDTAVAFTIMNELEKRFKTSNGYFKTRFNLLKGHVNYLFHPKQSSELAKFLCQQAINQSYEVGDPYLIAFANAESGRFLSSKTEELELATTYLLASYELYEQLPSQPERQYRIFIPLGELLFHCREFEKSILFTRKAIESLKDTGVVYDEVRTRMYNTLAQDFEQLGELDSAILYYNVSLTLAKKINNIPWIGMNKGFIGQVFFKQEKYDSSRSLLEYDYQVNRYKEHALAAKSLLWLARLDAVNGKNNSALSKARESLNILKTLNTSIYLQAGSYLEMTYYTLADVHRSLANLDSFYYYFRLYSSLHDSLQRVVTLSNTKTSQIRIDNERNIRAIQVLEKERKNEDLKRNFLIVVILLFSVILFLYVKKLRLNQRHKNEMTEHRQKVAESELKSAREQMKLFTENIIGQTDLIEKLQNRLQHKELDVEQQRVIEELTHQTILTEQDWANFKRLFEKIYPRFFRNLKERAHEITVAEQRMAALTRLNLTARQMASMLGISVDSVHKSRQRLRQRLQVPSDESLEKSIAAI